MRASAWQEQHLAGNERVWIGDHPAVEREDFGPAPRIAKLLLRNARQRVASSHDVEARRGLRRSAARQNEHLAGGGPIRMANDAAVEREDFGPAPRIAKLL